MGNYSSTETTPKVDTTITFDLADIKKTSPCPLCKKDVTFLTLSKHILDNHVGQHATIEDKFDVNTLNNV